jgi:hypothetical protein
MVGKSTDKIIGLLDYHRITLVTGEEIWCAAAGGPKDEAFAAKVGPPRPLLGRR